MVPAASDLQKTLEILNNLSSINLKTLGPIKAYSFTILHAGKK